MTNEKNLKINYQKGVLGIKLYNLRLDGYIRTRFKGRNYKKVITTFLTENNIPFVIVNENGGDLEKIKLA